MRYCWCFPLPTISSLLERLPSSILSCRSDEKLNKAGYSVSTLSIIFQHTHARTYTHARAHAYTHTCNVDAESALTEPKWEIKRARGKV